jgi:mRNA-degrading endonuclease RelE of RelBE toxin-antitoxin system
MVRCYRVVGSNAFEPEVRRLRTRLSHIYKPRPGAVGLLETDPLTLEGRGSIPKLGEVPAGEGQFRLRIGDYVIVHSMRPRGKSYR